MQYKSAFFSEPSLKQARESRSEFQTLRNAASDANVNNKAYYQRVYIRISKSTKISNRDKYDLHKYLNDVYTGKYN